MLRFQEDRRTLSFVAVYFALVAVQWVTGPHAWYIAVPLFLATCAFSWFCAVITHNVIHSALFDNRIANKAFQVVLTLTYGHPVSSFVSGHNLSHHRYTQEDRDVMRTTKARFRWNLLNLLFFFPAISGTIFKSDVAFSRQMRTQRPRWFRQFVLEAAALIAVTGVLLILDWQKALIFWVAPHVWAAYGIVTMNLLQHDGCDETSEFNHSRNFVGRVFGWYTFNNGFHSVHHKYPKLHWSKLREVHEREFEPHMHPSLNQASLYGYVWTTYFWPGKRENYDGTPYVLPDAVPDKSWIPASRSEMPDVSLGAEA